MRKTSKPSVLLSVFACSPNRGSEPGIGWAWAIGMAKRRPTYVLTRACYQNAIEEAIAKLQIPDNQKPIFYYFDLFPSFRENEIGRFLSLRVYYVLWQMFAPYFLKKQGVHTDIIHHVNWCSYVIPGMWYHRKEKVVLGPMGGFSFCPPPFLKSYGVKEKIKEVGMAFFRKRPLLNPFFRKAIKNADALVFTEEKKAERFNGKSIIEVAIPDTLSQRLEQRTKENQFIWAGVFETRKGFEIAVKAFAYACKNGLPEDVVLKVFGKGPKEKKYVKLVSDLEMTDRILFCGNVSQNQLWNEMSQSKAIIFSSLRDTSGNVVSEGMTLGVPTVCFNHQGVADITDETCAFRIKPEDFGKAITGFSTAMIKLATDTELQKQMSETAQKRAFSHFTWDAKFDFFENIYDGVSKKKF